MNNQLKSESVKKNTALTYNTLVGMFWSFSGTFMQGISQFVVLIVLTRLISAEDFGIVSAALVVIGLSTIFSTLGVGPAIVQRKNIEETHIKTGYSLSIIFGLLLTILLWLTSPIISTFFNIMELKAVLRSLSVVFLIQSFSVVSLSLLQREMNFKLIAKVQVISFISGYGVFSIVLALIGFNYWSLVFGHLAQNVINSFMLISARRHSKKIELKRETLKELLFFGGGFTIARVFNYLANQGDNLMTGRLLGVSALGLYGRAYQLMVMPANLFGQVLDKVLFSAMAQVQTNIKSLQRSYKTGLMATALLVMPLSTFIFLLAPEIILLLLGNNWLETVAPFQILSIGMFFRTSYKISDSVSRATGFVYRRAWRQGLYALFVFLGSYFGHFWGLEGITVGIVVALFLNFLMMAHLSLEILSMKWLTYVKVHLPAMILSIFVFIQTYSIIYYLRGVLSNNVLLFLTAFLFMLTLLTATIIFPKWFLGSNGLRVLNSIKKVIKKK